MPRALLALLLLTAPLFADEPKKKPPLNIGDPAPKLEVTRWLTKQEGKGFEKDSVYVVCFYHTGGFDIERPINRGCLDDLTDLHDKYAGKGLSVVGVVYPNRFEIDDEKLPPVDRLKKAATENDWLAEELQSVTFPVGWDSKRRLQTAFFTQDDKSELRSVVGGDAPPPKVAVIDQRGKVAYIGDYEAATYAAEKVLAGTWKGKADAEAIADGRAKWKKFIRGMYDKYPTWIRPTEKQYRELLETDIPAMEALVKKYPSLLADHHVQSSLLSFHMHGENAKAVGEYIDAQTVLARKRKNLGEFNSLYYTLQSNLNKKPSDAMCRVVSKYADTYAKLTLEFNETHPAQPLRDMACLCGQYGLADQMKEYSKETLARLNPLERDYWQGTLDRGTKPRVLLGDPAPPLNVEKWLHGKEVPPFEKGKVYLVAFLNDVIYPVHVAWEVGPRGREVAPAEFSLLSDIAERDAKKGLVVVGVVRERFLPKTQEKLTALLALHTADAKRSQTNFPIGWGNENKTGVGFDVHGRADYAVIDQDGRLVYTAYRHYPLNAVYVAKKVLEGKWNVADFNKPFSREVKHEETYSYQMFNLEKELLEAGYDAGRGLPFDAKKVKQIGETYLPKLEKVLKDTPELLECGTQHQTLFTASGAVQPVLFSLHLLAGKYEVPEKLLMERVKRAVELKNPYILHDYAKNLVNNRFEATPQLKKLIEKASKELEPLAGHDPTAGLTWLHLAVINSVYGNDDKAGEYFEKASAKLPFEKVQAMVKEYDELREKAGKSRR